MLHSTPAIRSMAKKARIVLHILFALSLLGWIMPEFLGLGGIDISITENEITVTNPDIQTRSMDSDIAMLEVPAWFDLFMITTTLLSILLWIMIIYQIDRLFSAFQQGSLFSSRTTWRLSNIGWIMLAAAILSSVQEITDAQLFESLMAAAGEKALEGVSTLFATASIDFPVLIGALAITVIARVMKKAAELQDEMNSVI